MKLFILFFISLFFKLNFQFCFAKIENYAFERKLNNGYFYIISVNVLVNYWIPRKDLINNCLGNIQIKQLNSLIYQPAGPN